LAKAYQIAWVLLLAAFVLVGGRGIALRRSGAPLTHNAPFASTDAYFEVLFDISAGSQRCIDVLRRVPRTGAIIFFCPPHDTRGAFGFGLFTYLSWPRQMRRVEVEDAQLEDALRSVDRSSTAALVFCNLPHPPGFARGWTVGPRIFVAPLDQTQ